MRADGKKALPYGFPFLMGFSHLLEALAESIFHFGLFIRVSKGEGHPTRIADGSRAPRQLAEHNYSRRVCKLYWRSPREIDLLSRIEMYLDMPSGPAWK